MAKDMRALKGRIRGVQGALKITHAMKLVSTAKLARARPRADSIRRFAREVQAAVGYLGQIPPGQVKGRVVVAFGTDRGLVGALNTSVVRQIAQYEHESPVIAVGQKLGAFMPGYGLRVVRTIKGLGDAPGMDAVRDIVEALTGSIRLLPEELVFIYPLMRSALEFEVVREVVIPARFGPAPDVIFVPSYKAVIDEASQLHVASRILLALAESRVIEFTQRIRAMDNASRKAEDLLDELSILYNRARRERITREMAEVIGGAEALG
ncbi:MAG: FoF1 ATP synthase subunit gamma [Bacillota bacterium]